MTVSSEATKYILDDEYDSTYTSTLDYLTPFDIHDENSVRQLAKDLRGASMRSGEPILPLFVLGAKPPTTPALHKPSPARRKVKTRCEIYSEFYVKPETNSAVIIESGKNACDNDEDEDEDSEEDSREMGIIEKPKAIEITSITTKPTFSNFDDYNDESDGEYECVNRNNNFSTDATAESGSYVKIKRELNQKQDQIKTGASSMVLVIDSRRLMQLYFAKKFLQLNVLADVHYDILSAVKAIALNPTAYSLVLLSHEQLNCKTLDSLANSLSQMMDPEEANWPEKEREEIKAFDWSSFDPSLFSSHLSLVVYGLSVHGDGILMINEDDEEMKEEDSTDVSEDTLSDEEHWSERREKRITRRFEQVERRKRREVKRKMQKDRLSVNTILECLEFCGVRDILEEPYTLGSIKNILDAHFVRQKFDPNAIESSKVH